MQDSWSAAAVALSLDPPAQGWGVLACVVAYAVALLWVCRATGQTELASLAGFLVLVSVFQVLPDWVLADLARHAAVPGPRWTARRRRHPARHGRHVGRAPVRRRRPERRPAGARRPALGPGLPRQPSSLAPTLGLWEPTGDTHRAAGCGGLRRPRGGRARVGGSDGLRARSGTARCPRAPARRSRCRPSTWARWSWPTSSWTSRAGASPPDRHSRPGHEYVAGYAPAAAVARARPAGPDRAGRCARRGSGRADGTPGVGARGPQADAEAQDHPRGQAPRPPVGRADAAGRRR